MIPLNLPLAKFSGHVHAMLRYRTVLTMLRNTPLYMLARINVLLFSVP